MKRPAEEVVGHLNDAARLYHQALLLDANRRQDALAYAEAALCGYASYGDAVAADVQETRQLIERVRQGAS